tara:strand:+ start:54776 stop:55288 length:513 start_codon:yes stop_codon:yes gene_type:complete
MTQNSSPSVSNASVDGAGKPHPKDKWIPFYFVIFFVVIAILDGFFVYMAVSTQTGVVTDHAYERGLNFNALLDETRSQPDLQETALFNEGTLSWQLNDQHGAPITDASVQASIQRPVQDGYDFDIALTHQGGGLYSAHLDLPLKGLWKARLHSTWNTNQTYRTQLKFISQ